MQVFGLLLMLFGLAGVLASSGPGLLALADPCVPDKGAPAVSGPATVQMVRATPAASASPAKELTSYPVFAPTDTLATPTPAPQQTTPPPSPTPSALPPGLSPCPTHRHHLFGEGPIEFSGTGGVTLGRHQSEAFNASQSSNDANLSMALHIGRRTQRSSISLDESFGATSGTGPDQVNLSQLNLVYSTPQYYVGYGIVSTPTDTQLSDATFNRGITLGVPRGQDEIDLILGRSTGSSGEGFGVVGLRHSGAYPHGLLFSQTLYVARGDTSHGQNTALDLSLGRYKSGATYRGEVALSNTRDIPGVSDGTRLAYALHADFFSEKTSTSIGYFSIPQGYLILGDALTSQKNLSFTHRRPFLRRGAFTFDYGDLLETVSGSTSRTAHEAFNLQLPVGSVLMSQTLINFAQTNSDGVSTNERDFGETFTEQFPWLGLTQTYQTSLLSQPGSPSIGQSQIALGASRPLWRGFISFNTSRTRVFGLDNSGSQVENAATIEQPIGAKAQISYAIDSLRVSTGGADQSTNQFMQTYSFTRRLSPVVAARVTYSLTRQSGALGGVAHYLNFDIVGPLAFGGAARYSGRPNPNLPAIVEGHVFLQNEASSYGLTGNRGIPNVLVTLDGGLTQRTDATGAYEFRFVRPGVHALTISTGTLPPGVIPDSATQSFTIQGGQIFNVDFSAGLFAGVQGRVVQMHGSTEIPVAGIQLVVDNKQRGYTASDGSYQIGHLSPGRHTVAIVVESLPSNVTAPGDGKKEVTVTTGSLATLNWQLTGLGSIEGEVLFTSDSGFGDLQGAKDVYVVADPGEHAAITDDDGHFLIDNLPAGQYTLSVDADSLPDGEAIVQGPDGPVTIAGGEAIQGITFKVGAKAKQVIMTFSGGPSAAVDASFVPDQVPQGGIAELRVSTNAKGVKSVLASGDIGSFPLHYDRARKLWIARFKAPAVQNGDYLMHVDVKGETSGGGDASITISNAIQTVVAHGVPAHPSPGQTVRVVAKIVADVEAGDIVAMEGGQQFKLPKPRGDVFVFSVRAPHALPLRGIIFTKRGERIPFVIQP
ncbi:MAG TPA: carboxypeptidase-like regulatory domain-containing protein [Candidatus Aquilonibacter sp.]|nr:carboxypeptidase-like regulatory domain-containing protein [Candidatus Aquilonibacter sp.]